MTAQEKFVKLFSLLGWTPDRHRIGDQDFDVDGELARSGQVHQPLLNRLLETPYLDLAPPKTTGRELFGESFLDQALAWPEARGLEFAAVAATFAEFTVRSIADAVSRYVPPEFRIGRVIVGGGGAKNPYLMERLRRALAGADVLLHEEFGIPSKYKEAIAFAMLGAATLVGLPGNVPSCTGAEREVVLGSITPGRDYLDLARKAHGLRDSWLG